MTKTNRAPLLLSATALVIAVAGVGGPAVARAYDAMNAHKVDGKHAVGAGASTTQRKGKLVATSGTTGRLPNNIIAMAPNADKVDGLHANAISRAGRTGAMGLVPDTEMTMASVSLTAPGNGFVLVTASTKITYAAAWLKLANADQSQSSFEHRAAIDNSGYGDTSVTYLFKVTATAGQTVTFDLRGHNFSFGNTAAFATDMSALWVPFGPTGTSSVIPPPPN